MMRTIRCMLGITYVEMLSLLRNRTQAAIFLFIPFLIFFFLAGIYRDPVILHVPTVILDLDHSSRSREVIGEIRANPVLRIVGYANDEAEVNHLLASEKARVAIVIPQDFEEALGRGGPTRIMTIIDGSNMVFTNVASAASADVVSHLSAKIRAGLLQSHGMLTEKVYRILTAVQFTTTAKDNPTYNYAFFLLFGLGINILQQTYLLGTATMISREKQQKTWIHYQLMPVRHDQVVMAKILPYLLVGIFQLSLLFVWGNGFWGLPLKGSRILLLVSSILFLLAVSAFAVVVSVVTRTVNSIRFTMVMAMPSFVLSGYTWPLEAMHPVARAISQCLPLTWYLKVFQAVTMKEAGLVVVWPFLVYMAIIAVFCYSLALYLMGKSALAKRSPWLISEKRISFGKPSSFHPGG